MNKNCRDVATGAERVPNTLWLLPHRRRTQHTHSISASRQAAGPQHAKRNRGNGRRPALDDDKQSKEQHSPDQGADNPRAHPGEQIAPEVQPQQLHSDGSDEEQGAGKVDPLPHDLQALVEGEQHPGGLAPDNEATDSQGQHRHGHLEEEASGRFPLRRLPGYFFPLPLLTCAVQRCNEYGADATQSGAGQGDALTSQSSL
ncbi:hypothetical protein MAJ_11459, partial [Metarhizium majus ARSEF 297]